MPIDKMNPMAAAGAYANIAKNVGTGAPSAPTIGTGGSSFGDMLEGAMKTTIDTVREGEKASALAVTGKANITDVVQAVTDAKLTLESFVAVRDSSIEAYNRIMGMPI